MPVETAVYIADLNPANPVHTDGLNAADSHIRMLKSTLQATFPDIGDTAVTASAADLNGVVGLASFADGTVTAPVPTGSTTIGGTVILTGAPASPTPYANVNVSNVDGGLVVSTGAAADVSVIATLDPVGNLTLNETLNCTSVLQNGHVLMPTGGCIVWTGSASAIPPGWYLCNGSNGTPDLQDSFVVGAGNSYSVGQTGGAATSTATSTSAGSHNHGGATASGGSSAMTGSSDSQGAHDHGGSDGAYTLQATDIPAHTHTVPAQGPGSYGPSGNATVATGNGTHATDTTTSAGSGGGGPHSHTISTDGTHSHNITVSSTPNITLGISSDGAHTHATTAATLPPFYALCWIMWGG